MKILLINPSSPNIAKISTDFDLKIGNIGRFPPIGLISLAAYVRQNSNHQIEILDADADGMGTEAISNYIEGRGIDVIGITAFTYTFYDVLEIVRAIKNKYKNITIVIGGPHTSLFGKETLSHPEIDYLIIGEGEEPFLHLLNKLEVKEMPDGITGVGFRDGKEVFIGEPSWVEYLDKLPFPAYDLLNPDKYHSTFGEGGKTITLCSSRGCPFKCTYCQVLTKKYRSHSVDYIIEYMKSFYQKEYKNFYFFDDLFNITSKRVIELSKKILEEKMDVKWIFRGRVNNITEEVCREASKAGCVQILFGVEDYTDEGLKAIRKSITIEQVKAAVSLCRKYGIKTSTNWIIGLPSHKSLGDIDGLVNTAIAVDSDYAMFTILQLLPGCEMFEQAVQEGVVNRDSWRNYAMNPTPSYQIEFYDKYISGDKLSEAYALAHKKYYRRIGYIFKSILRLRSFSELKTKVPVALNVLLARKN